MITFVHKGDFKKTEDFLKSANTKGIKSILSSYGQMGVEALAAATPKRSGKTAASWTYTIEESKGSVSIVWSNTNVNDGVNIAVLIQYGHGTRNGGYVKGIDYINPAMRPVFEKIADGAWKEVVSK